MPPPPEGTIPSTVEGERSLSAALRTSTAPVHLKTERLLGLPGAIRTRSDYVLWLQRFLGFYAPLRAPPWVLYGVARVRHFAG